MTEHLRLMLVAGFALGVIFATAVYELRDLFTRDAEL